MFPKTDWEVGDKVVVNNKHGEIKEFSPDNKKAYVEHRDNENHAYVRWYGRDELPVFQTETPPPTPPRIQGEGTKEVQEVAIVQAPEGLRRGVVLHHKTLNYNRIIESLDGLTLTFAMGCGKVQWDSSVWEIVAPDADTISMMLNSMDTQRGRIDELDTKVKYQLKQIENQAVTLAAWMKEGGEDFQDKFEQLNDDYETLAKKLLVVETERDELKKVNDKQSEMLREAAQSSAVPFSTDVNPQNTVESLRAENTLLHRDLDKAREALKKALKSPFEALEVRLSSIEEKLTEATDWIEGHVSDEMDEAERELEAQMQQPKADGLLIFLQALNSTATEMGLIPFSQPPKPAA